MLVYALRFSFASNYPQTLMQSTWDARLASVESPCSVVRSFTSEFVSGMILHSILHKALEVHLN